MFTCESGAKCIHCHCRKVLLPGTVSNLTSDAKFGGPIHIEALPHQDAVSIDSCCSCKSGQACSAMRDACTPLALKSWCTQVPLAASTSVTLEVTESSGAATEDGRSTYSLQVLSAQQMANKQYPAAWLQVSFGKLRPTAKCSLQPTFLLSPFCWSTQPAWTNSALCHLRCRCASFHMTLQGCT